MSPLHSVYEINATYLGVFDLIPTILRIKIYLMCLKIHFLFHKVISVGVNEQLLADGLHGKLTVTYQPIQIYSLSFNIYIYFTQVTYFVTSVVPFLQYFLK